MEGIIKQNNSKFTYKKGEFIGLGFKEILHENTKEPITLNNIEDFINLLINNVEEVQMIEAHNVYECEKCKKRKKEKCVTIRHHKEIEKINLYCTDCGIPMKLIDVSNRYK